MKTDDNFLRIPDLASYKTRISELALHQRLHVIHVPERAKHALVNLDADTVAKVIDVLPRLYQYPKIGQKTVRLLEARIYNYICDVEHDERIEKAKRGQV